MRAVIAHCWTGHPWDGWYPSAKTDLQALGIDVEIPSLPDTETPDPAAWVSALDRAIGGRESDTLVIGHSLGAVAVLHWLATCPQNVCIPGLFLVAPPLALTGIAEVDRFLSPAPDLAGVEGKVVRAAVLVSDVDKYLVPSPGVVAQDLARAIGAQVLVSPGRGHFSPASGLRTLPELTAWIEVGANS